MILRFKTNRNQYGHRHILAIDTDKKVYCTESWSMKPTGEVITKKAMNNIICACANDGYILTEAF